MKVTKVTTTLGTTRSSGLTRTLEARLCSLMQTILSHAPKPFELDQPPRKDIDALLGSLVALRRRIAWRRASAFSKFPAVVLPLVPLNARPALVGSDVYGKEKPRWPRNQRNPASRSYAERKAAGICVSCTKSARFRSPFARA